jgi:hypothetical protein
MERRGGETAGGWRGVGAVEATELAEARLLLHHAAQLAASPGRSLLPPRPDDSQTAFEWIPVRGLLAGEWLETPEGPVRPALEMSSPALLVLGDAGAAVARRDLAGETLASAFAWLRDALGSRGVDVSRLSRDAPYDLPPSAVSSGTAFPSPPFPGSSELSLYFEDAHLVLRDLVDARADVSPLRCWPHHFDLGALITRAAAGEGAPTVGLGFSPGDGTYPEPYFYVTVWPAPAPSVTLPALSSGARWHREGWCGAVLTGSHLVESREPAAQEARARGFLTEALPAAERLAFGGAVDGS